MFRLLFTILFAATLLRAQPQQTWVDSIYAQMTLEQKIGQLFMVIAYPDGNASKRMATSKQIQTQHIGGVLFSKGTSKQQVRDTRTYQNQASIPLLIGADAEWGMAMRLTDVPAYPYAMTLGALPHSDLIYALGKRIGMRKCSMGVHVTFAPVLNVNSESKNPIIGVRSFGDDPNNVAKQGLAFMDGLLQAGVWAVAKHFPGHGAAVQDSHVTLPRINRSSKALDSIDLFPFQHLIDNSLKGVMVGHLAVPALTKNDSIPVSTSYEVTSDLLQHQMGFNGLVFTDALNMKGVTNRIAQPALRAFLAGADILLVP
jgi:beta-glucosidase-like glycosyl hydrolase